MQSLTCSIPQDLHFEILRRKTHIFCNVREDSAVAELKKIIAGILKVCDCCAFQMSGIRVEFVSALLSFFRFDRELTLNYGLYSCLLHYSGWNVVTPLVSQ